ncbi:hypothetical protein D3C81_2096970 [compost metagenome]
MRLRILQQLALCQQRVELDLIHSRHNSSVVDDILQMMRLEVAHTNGFDEPLFLQMHQRLPGIAVLAGYRPMDQIQINYIQSKLLAADLISLQG